MAKSEILITFALCLWNVSTGLEPQLYFVFRQAVADFRGGAGTGSSAFVIRECCRSSDGTLDPLSINTHQCVERGVRRYITEGLSIISILPALPSLELQDVLMSQPEH